MKLFTYRKYHFSPEKRKKSFYLDKGQGCPPQPPTKFCSDHILWSVCEKIVATLLEGDKE